jgi:hypothetical protein
VSNSLLVLDAEVGTEAQGAAIKSYLVKKGVAEKRIRIRASGEAKKPVGLSLSYF